MEGAHRRRPGPHRPAPSVVRIDTVAALHSLKSKPGEAWQVVLPAEGSLLRIHHWAIPATAPKPALSEAALKSLVNPAAAARLAVEDDLGVTQPEAKKLLPPALLLDPLLYPAHPLLNNTRFVR